MRFNCLFFFIENMEINVTSSLFAFRDVTIKLRIIKITFNPVCAVVLKLMAIFARYELWNWNDLIACIMRTCSE